MTKTELSLELDKNIEQRKALNGEVKGILEIIELIPCGTDLYLSAQSIISKKFKLIAELEEKWNVMWKEYRK